MATNEMTLEHSDNCPKLLGGYSKNQIVPSLKLIADEPEFYSDVFGYDDYSSRLFSLLKESLPDRPFAICLDGKPGEGKTSLLYRIYTKFKQDSNVTNFHAIWFDAWKYERVEPSFMMLTKILNEFASDAASSKQMLELMRSLAILVYGGNFAMKSEGDQADRSIMLKQVIEYLDEISSVLSTVIGSGKLYVFIDHLDRCKPETITETLRTISTTFSSSKIRFVVGADMERIEQLAQPGLASKVVAASSDNLTLIDKLFQLRLVMPVKDEKMMEEYVERLGVLFPTDIKHFLAHSLPRNPRRAKEALNLAFYISSLASEDEFGTVLPYIFIWSILATSFYSISKRIREEPEALLDLSLIASRTKNFKSFSEIMRIAEGDENENLFHINLKIPWGKVSPLAIDICYSHIRNNPELYDFLKSIFGPLDLALDTKSQRAENLKTTMRYVSLIS